MRKDIMESPPAKMGNQIMTIEERPTPVNLRTMMYLDAKRFVRAVGKFVVAAVLLVLVYHYFGLWGIVSFGFMFFLAWVWIIPRIAERFMTYVNLVTLELRPDKPDEIKIYQLSHARFQQCAIVDSLGQKSALNSPFLSVLGFTYLVDQIDLDIHIYGPNGEHIPGLSDVGIDRIMVNPVHKNVDFVKYKQAMLKLREDLILTSNENFALKAKLEVEVESRSNEKATHIFVMLRDVLCKAPEPVSYEKFDGILREIEALIAAGIDVTKTSHKDLLSKLGSNVDAELLREAIR